MAVAALVATIAGAASGAFSSFMANKQAAEAKEQAAKFDRKIAEASQRSAMGAGRAQAEKVRARNRRLRATQRTQFAAAGVMISDSANLVILDSDIQGELDALTTENNAAVAATGFQNQALLARYREDAASDGLLLSQIMILSTGMAQSGQAAGTFAAQTRNPQPGNQGQTSFVPKDAGGFGGPTTIN